MTSNPQPREFWRSANSTSIRRVAYVDNGEVVYDRRFIGRRCTWVRKSCTTSAWIEWANRTRAKRTDNAGNTLPELDANGNAIPEARLCFHCHIEKPVSEFGIDNSKPDGLRSWCRECTRECDRLRRDRVRNGVIPKRGRPRIQSYNPTPAELAEFRRAHGSTGVQRVADHVIRACIERAPNWTPELERELLPERETPIKEEE